MLTVWIVCLRQDKVVLADHVGRGAAEGVCYKVFFTGEVFQLEVILGHQFLQSGQRSLMYSG